MGYEIRQVRPDEWRRSKELRLAALKDPVSSVAFVRTYEEEAAFADEVWQGRTSRVGAQQFVAEDENGVWAGSLVVLVEPDDSLSIVGVYLRPEVRGTGLAEKLFGTALEWVWERVDRVQLWVHEGNPRAQAFYARLGFTRTGKTMPFPLDETQKEYEMVLLRP
ncbi:GNAT family N-acetyltransferase [Streptomyces sp. NPDC059373]